MSILPFDYHGQEVRFITDESGEPQVVASDLAKALNYRNAPDMMRSIDLEERGTRPVRTPGGEQEMLTLTEAGMYQAILQRQTGRMVDVAQRAAVKRFQHWVTHEVIPSIRKRGGYLTPEAIEKTLTDPDFIIRLATELKAERAARLELAAQAKADAPKVLFADSVSVSHTTILVGELAKILRGNGVEIGQNRLFKVLRQRGYLISRNGSDRNMPTQRAMDLGLFEIKETAITHSDGHVSVSKTPKVTGKGQVYFVNRFLSGHLGQISEQGVAA